MEELQSLRNAGYEWITQNGVQGFIFGTMPYQIFLPASGWRGSTAGALGDGVWGAYWSSTQGNNETAWILTFNSNDVGIIWHFRTRGFSVRCVAR